MSENLSYRPDAGFISLEEVRRAAEWLASRWRIASPTDSLHWQRRLESEVPEGLRSKYAVLNAQQAGHLLAGRRIPKSILKKWYALIANRHLSGVIHSIKFPYILDSVAFIASLYRWQNRPGSIVDAGCNSGYMVDILSSILQCPLFGIDNCHEAILMAKGALRGRAGIQFEELDFWKNKLPAIENAAIIACVDSFPLDTAVLHRMLQSFLSTLMVNGMIVLAGDLLQFEDGEIARICTDLGLRLRAHEVTGGWDGAMNCFDNRILVALGRDGNPVPHSLYKDWGDFKTYANDASVSHDEKTQAFYLAKLFSQSAVAS